MAFRPVEGTEPIPGYRLDRRLGTGGYGEVWRATVPGGLAKALKIVYGNLHDARAEQELKSLSRIREVRHPFLISLERFEIIEDQLVIVMELADGSLLDCFERYRRSEKPGIPREELLGYMRDAAEALDYMNDHYDLQHLDIKPQNLLLVGGRVKVADFGLVKDLEGTSATATGGVTPIYASPEAFDGKISRHSDQYSLAIVYQELLTGVRPFPGKTTFQLAAQHMNSPPLLDALPATDRPAVARALEKSPERRFPRCGEMIDQLRKAEQTAPPPARGTTTVARAPTPPPHLTPPTGKEGEEDLSLDTLAALSPPAAEPSKSEVVRPAATGSAWPADAESRALRPTLVVGVGGIAGLVLRSLRHRLHVRFGGPEAVPIYRLLLLDTDRGGLRLALHGRAGEMLPLEESLHLPLHRPEHYRSRSRQFLRWLERRWMYGIPRSLLTEGMRPLGRLAFIDAADECLLRFRDELRTVMAPASRATTQSSAGVRVEDGPPRVVVVASVSGGTGGGAVADVAYALRQTLEDIGAARDAVTGILVHATGGGPPEIELARVNTVAALTELAHYAAPGAGYPGDTSAGLRAGRPGEGPFLDTYLLHLGDGLDAPGLRRAADGVADYLYLTTVSPASAPLERHRTQTEASNGTGARTAGLRRLSFPRYEIIEEAALLLGRDLVRRWLDGEPGFPVEAAKAAAPQRVEELGLSAQAIGDQLHSVARAALGDDPEQRFQQLLEPLGERAPSASTLATLEAARRTLARISETFGRPEQPAPLEVALRKEAAELGQRLADVAGDWLARTTEDPAGRFRAAVAATQGLAQHLSALGESARYLVQQQRTRRDEMEGQLAQGDFGPRVGGPRWLGMGRRQPGSDGPHARFTELCRARLKELIFSATVDVIKQVSLRVAKFSQDLELGREKLAHLADCLAADRQCLRDLDAVAGSDYKAVLPEGCANVSEAAEAVLRDIPAESRDAWDQEFRCRAFSRDGGAWGVISRHVDLSQTLREPLIAIARRAIAAALGATDATRLLTEGHASETRLGEMLAAQAALSTPRLRPSGSWRHLFVAVRPGPDIGTLTGALDSITAVGATSLVESEGDVVFCSESAPVPYGRMAAAVCGQQPSVRDLAMQVMTRTDLAWRPLEGA